MNRVERLAREFARRLRAEIGEAGMAEVVSRNKAERNPAICHSHDFVDSNQTMLDAWQQVAPGGALPRFPLRGVEAEVWDTAWGMAKYNYFWVVVAEQDPHEPRDYNDADGIQTMGDLQ